MLTVIDHLRRNAETDPDRTIFTYRNLQGRITESLTAGELERRSNAMAAQLASRHGLKHGDVVLLACHPGLTVIEGLIACAKIGVIAAPVPPVGLSSGATGVDRLAAIAADSGAQVVLADRRQYEAAASLGREGASGSRAANAVAGLDWIDLSTLSGEQDGFDVDPHELLFLQYTSGSTRQPRGVMVSHANVVANCPRDGGPDWVCVSWLPHFHDMGLIGYFLFPMAFGGSSHILSTADFMRRPALWLETISAVRATNTSAPDFAYAYCLREDKLPDDALAGIDLSSLRDMMNASEPVRPATIRAFRDRFGRCGLDPTALTVAYGLAENTLRVSDGGRVHLTLSKDRLARGEVRTARGGEMAANVVEVASCGRPVAGVEMLIVDPESGQEKEPGASGEIWIAGGGKARGYWRHDDLTEAVFGGRLAGRPEKYLRTGDIGFVRDGEVYVCGRLRDMVVLRGRNIFPADVEGAIEARFAEIEPGRVAVFGSAGDRLDQSGLTVIIEARRGVDAPPLDILHRYVVNVFQVPVDAVAVVRRGSIVKTSSGKISRSRCQHDFLAGDLDVLARYVPESFDDGTESAEGYLDALVERAGAGAEATIGDLGLDSVELVELSIRLEDLAEANGLEDRARLASIHDLRLLQAATVADIKATVAGLASGSVDAEAVAGSLAEAIRAVADGEAARMREDALLDPSWRPAPALDEAGATLVTGASGFLGSHLLAGLLRQTRDRIVAVVRAQSEAHGRARLRSALIQTGMAGSAADEALAGRVAIVCGDVARASFGLDDAQWDRLAREVSRVFHCAAEVDYRKTYGELRAANVEATRETIRLSMEGRAKELNHISTTFIFGWTNWTSKAEHMRNGEMSGLDFGYSQSKWVAEQLVFAAGERGLTVRMFRPSLVSAPRSGHFVRSDITSRLFGYCMRHGVSVETDKQLSLVPADVCGENIVAIAGLKESAGRTFHLTSDTYRTFADVCRTIGRDFGYRFAYADIDGFVGHVNANCDRDDDLFPLKSFINASKDKLKDVAFERYDNAVYREFRAKSRLALSEPPLEETVARLVGFLRASGLVPPAPRNGSDAKAMAEDAA